jgi:hypothetical protein
MATLKTYVRTLWTAEKTIYSKLSGGVQDLRVMPYWSRLIVLTLDVILGVLIKALTDKGVLTDAELNAAITGATGATYPVQPEMLPVEDEDAGTHPVDPDVGV